MYLLFKNDEIGIDTYNCKGEENNNLFHTQEYRTEIEHVYMYVYDNYKNTDLKGVLDVDEEVECRMLRRREFHKVADQTTKGFEMRQIWKKVRDLVLRD